MKQITVGLLFGILILTACRQVPAGDAPATVESTMLASPTETPTTVLATLTPSPTQTPTTETITPLPTIPTFTPTFEAQTIVTVTPAAPATCPRGDPNIVPNFSGPNLYSSDDILIYLNAGGTLDRLVDSFSEREPDSINGGKIVDLTGDGVSEVVYKLWVRYGILGCKDGKYQSLFDFEGDWGVSLEGTPDLNKNGIPELVLYNISHYGSALVYVFEWNGSEFRSLIDAGRHDDWVLASSPVKIMDRNGDGLKEIVVVYSVQEFCGGLGNPCDGTPIRRHTTTLGWNGQNYVDLMQGNYAPPQYRFQAIQDGDWQTRYGNYAEALSLYREAIFNDHLAWWSPERNEYEKYVYLSQFYSEPILTPSPIPDDTEYPRLAAYADYRIMLLHLIQGHESEAGTVYETLQQKFGNDPYGRPYVEMATAFWKAYQSSEKMYDGCAAAIEYAAEHPAILTPLGSDYHGSQSHTYVPVDVCPFR